MTEFTSYSWYLQLVNHVYTCGHEDLNLRTNTRIKALPNLSVALDLSSEFIPNIGLRQTWPHVAAAELAWTLSGERDIAFISKYSKMWDKFALDVYTPGAGKTREVQAAYGWRWREHFKRDQLEKAINTLLSDPSDRQCVVMAWDPACDGLGDRSSTSLNVPCPLGFTVNLIGGRLNMDVYLRSSDLVIGLPYDVMHYALLLDAMVASLNLAIEAASTGAADGRFQPVARGSLALRLSHAHIYEPHYDVAKYMLEGGELDLGVEDGWKFKGLSLQNIMLDPDRYVQLHRVRHVHPYNPKLEAVL